MMPRDDRRDIFKLILIAPDQARRNKCSIAEHPSGAPVA